MEDSTLQTLSQKEFIFLRHGETDWNLEGKFQGQTDIPLNNTGIEQALKCLAIVDKLGIESVYSSPLLRAYKTADIVSKNLNLEIIVEPLLMECSSEQTAMAIYSDLNVSKLPSFKYTTHKMEESPSQFISRCLQGVKSALTTRTQNTLIVSHGGVFWGICKNLRISPFKAPNAMPIRVFQNSSKVWSAEIIWK